MQQHYGIIGQKLGHSFSPAFFSEKFKTLNIAAEYHAFETDNLTDLIQDLKRKFGTTLKGLNVTIPYKKSIIPYLDNLDITAQEIGAVNCIAVENGKWIGYNTDTIGFSNTLTPLLPKNESIKALVLGTGGAAWAVQFALRNLKIEYTSVSRLATEYSISYEQVDAQCIAQHHLIINTTPLGMHPDIHTFPALPYEHITDKHIAYDLVYNPAETLFLTRCKQAGATICNGMPMLIAQAEVGWQIWQQTN